VPSPFGRKENYNKTYVFCSEDPFDFGHFSNTKTNNTKLVGILECHAPEIISYGEKYYITTCGWSGYPKPKEISDNPNGVYISRLKIE